MSSMFIGWQGVYLIVGFLIVVVFVYHVCVGAYNVLFNPLSRYPGLRTWAAFSYPFMYHMWSGTLPYRIRDLHQKYGDTVRVGPNELSFIQPEAWKEIYSKRESSRPFLWQGKFPGIDAHTLISAPASYHSRVRKAFGPTFSEKTIRLQEPLIENHISGFVAELRKRMQQGSDKLEAHVNLAEWINFATFDISADLGWGTSFDCVVSGKYHPWVLVVLWFKVHLLGVTMKMYPVLRAIMGMIVPPSLQENSRMVVETSKNNVADRLKKPSSRPDMVTAILDWNSSKGAEEQISQNEMVTNLATIIVAGSDPLASVIAGALTYLIRQPKYLAKLELEILSAYPSAQDITASSTQRLPYLRMVIFEALRLCTPVPDNMRRLWTPASGTTINGEYVPWNTVVGVSPYVTFRESAVFEDPDEFRPERWQKSVDGGAKDASFTSQYAGFHPFGFGPRSCIGQVLAWTEMRLVLTSLIRHFEIREIEKGDVRPWTSQWIYWTWERHPLTVRLRPRNSPP